MAALKIGFNEGTLLRRTLLHVGTFVVGSMAFIGLMSFMLVSIAKGLVGPRDGSAGIDDESDVPAAAAATATATAAGAKAPKPAVRPARSKRGGAAAPPALRPTKDE